MIAAAVGIRCDVLTAQSVWAPKSGCMSILGDRDSIRTGKKGRRRSAPRLQPNQQDHSIWQPHCCATTLQQPREFILLPDNPAAPVGAVRNTSRTCHGMYVSCISRQVAPSIPHLDWTKLIPRWMWKNTSRLWENICQFRCPETGCPCRMSRFEYRSKGFLTEKSENSEPYLIVMKPFDFVFHRQRRR